jgi:hypothetical protein
MREFIVALMFALLIAAPPRAAADDEAAAQPADLRVTVLDQTGAALVTATVTVIDDAGVPHAVTVDQKGVAQIGGLTAGTVHVKVEAEAFASYDAPLTLKKGANAITVHLPLAGLTEAVVVTEDTSDRSGNSFVTTLSEAEIAELPDDPDELEAMLNQMAGPGATMRVNGFRGGRLPPKNQIRQIRFRMNSYAADNHDAGGFGIDIVTKPGMSDWRGMTNFSFRDESLNARNAFADTLGAEQYRRFGFNFDGPLKRNKTSFAFSSDGNLSYDSQTIVAKASPDSQVVNGQVRRPLDVMNMTARVEHALTDRQTLLVEYQRQDDTRRNLGVGDYNLEPRAYTQENAGNLVRMGLTGLVAPKVSNELKVQFTGAQTDVSSTTDDPAIVVVETFATGGAGRFTNRRSKQLEIENNVDFAVNKRHAVRAGLLFEGFWYHSTELQNGNGTFTFSDLASFQAGRPTTYTQRVGGAPVDFAQYQLGLYAQDDITISKAFTLSLGVRQELQNTLGDRLNLAPRVGFTFVPNKWTFRGGWGIFDDWYDASLYEQTLRVNGINQEEIVILQPGFPDPYAGAAATVLPASIIRDAAGVQMPWLQQASIGVERNWGGLRLQTSYMMQRGFDQLRSRNANAPAPLAGRPDPLVGNVTEIESTGRLDVDRWQVNLNFARPERRQFFGMNYILSRSLNDSNSPLSLPADNYDLDAEWGPSMQDARHRLFAMAGFGLPKGFRMMLNSQFTSALPYNIITGLDTNGDGQTNDRPDGVGRNSARGSASWNLNARLSRAFTFGPPRQGGPGGPGGGPVRINGGGDRRGGGGLGGGPMMMMGGDQNQGRYRVEFYVQAFNLLNHVNYGSYVGNLRSDFFGDPTSAGPARRIEVGMLFGF